MVRRNESFALHLGPANRRDIVREAGFRAPSGHPERCLVCISLILLCRAWSKLDVQVLVCNWVGDPFKAWVAGSSPAALTKISRYLADFGRAAPPNTQSKRDSSFYAVAATCRAFNLSRNPDGSTPSLRRPTLLDSIFSRPLSHNAFTNLVDFVFVVFCISVKERLNLHSRDRTAAT